MWSPFLFSIHSPPRSPEFPLPLSMFIWLLVFSTVLWQHPPPPILVPGSRAFQPQSPACVWVLSWTNRVMVPRKFKVREIQSSRGYPTTLPSPCLSLHFFFLILMSIFYFWEVGRGRRERPEAGSRLWAVSAELDPGLKPMNCEIMTWAEVRHLTGWATQAPPTLNFL